MILIKCWIYDLDKSLTWKKKSTKKIPVNPNNCSGSWWVLLWYRQNPNADSMIIRSCRSSWPFSKTHSLCHVWYLSLCSSVALIFWGVLSLLCASFLSQPLLLDWRFHLNSRAFESYQAHITWMGAFWNPVPSLATTSFFSQLPFSLFLHNKVIILGPGQDSQCTLTLCSIMNHSYSCCALLTWLQLRFHKVTKFLNKFQAVESLWEEHCSPHSHLPQQKLN